MSVESKSILPNIGIKEMNTLIEKSEASSQAIKVFCSNLTPRNAMAEQSRFPSLSPDRITPLRRENLLKIYNNKKENGTPMLAWGSKEVLQESKHKSYPGAHLEIEDYSDEDSIVSELTTDNHVILPSIPNVHSSSRISSSIGSTTQEKLSKSSSSFTHNFTPTCSPFRSIQSPSTPKSYTSDQFLGLKTPPKKQLLSSIK